MLWSTLLLLLISGVWSDDSRSLEDELYDKLYRKCWKVCIEDFKNKTSQDALVQLFNDDFDLDKHEQFCGAYNSSKTCAHNCISKEEHEYYLRSFFRRNYLNDFICVKHFREFREYLPCYRNRRSLEFFFIKCGYFALDNTNALQATKRTCTALNCILRYIPDIIRHDCDTTSHDPNFAKKAGDLMERMVAAFLRERVKLNRMIRMCEGMK